MKEEKLNVEQLITELRWAVCNGSINTGILEKAADALEKYHRSSKFHAFIWNTLGLTTMRQLLDLYKEEQELDEERPHENPAL